MNQQQLLQSDEIDLRELWQIISKRKITIFITTFIVTVAAVSYIMTVAPVYSGNAMLEIGEVINENEVINNNKPTTIYLLDNVNSLKAIVTQATGLDVEIPKESLNIVRISMASSDLSKITPKLQSTVDFILTRHQEKAKFYQNDGAKIRMTQVIGKIEIGANPIRPQKAVVMTIALIGGLILGVMIAIAKDFFSRKRRCDLRVD